MLTATPGQTTIVTESGIPTNESVGFQVLKAATGSISIARTTLGVIERPAGSGNYVINFIAPPEGDLYLVVADWSMGVLDPATTRVSELKVTTEVEPGSTGLGAIADYARMHLGGETWGGLSRSDSFGDDQLARAVALVKAQVMLAPPQTSDEATLNPLLLDYLGICVALQLIEPAIDFWMNQVISQSVGNEPTEIVTYANRAQMMWSLRDSLMAKRLVAQGLALPYIDLPVLRSTGSGPAIDEDDDCRSTRDPRDVVAYEQPLSPVDAYGLVPTGVRRP